MYKYESNFRAKSWDEGDKVPTLSVFYGIIVRMYKETDAVHNFPHIHAKYNEYEIAMAFDGTILEGKLPNKQLNMLLAWLGIHEDDLKANWELLTSGEQIFRIEPLK